MSLGLVKVYATLYDVGSPLLSKGSHFDPDIQKLRFVNWLSSRSVVGAIYF